MIKVGITGGIGSGKTMVCRILESIQIPVYYADVAAKRLMQEDDQLIKDIQQAFGEESYSASGELNRAYLSEKVFRDKENLQKLNALVHPAVFGDTARWMESLSADVPYAAKEAALFFETGSNKQMDVMVTVAADKTVRIQRIMERDGVTEQQVLERMQNQLSQEEKIKQSDVVIWNNPEDYLLPQVYEMHQSLLVKPK